MVRKNLAVINKTLEDMKTFEFYAGIVDGHFIFNEDEPNKHLLYYKTGFATPSYMFQGFLEDYRKELIIAKSTNLKLIPLSITLGAKFQCWDKEFYSDEVGGGVSYSGVDILSPEQVEFDPCDGSSRIKQQITGFRISAVFIPTEELEQLITRCDDKRAK